MFPDWSEAQRDALLARSFAELGRNAAEWARLPALTEDEVLARVEVVGVEHVERALARGRGLLVATAHIGHWELIPFAMSVRLPAARICALGRWQPNLSLYRMAMGRRMLGRARVLPRDARSILNALRRRNAAVGVVADHYLSQRRGGVLAPFLGLRAWSNPGPATLALRADCPLLVVHAMRLADGRHRIAFEAELERPAGGDRAAAITVLTGALNDALGAHIRAEPHAWLWATRRFRASPDLDANPYAPRRRRRRR